MRPVPWACTRRVYVPAEWPAVWGTPWPVLGHAGHHAVDAGDLGNAGDLGDLEMAQAMARESERMLLWLGIH